MFNAKYKKLTTAQPLLKFGLTLKCKSGLCLPHSLLRSSLHSLSSNGLSLEGETCLTGDAVILSAPLSKLYSLYLGFMHEFSSPSPLRERENEIYATTPNIKADFVRPRPRGRDHTVARQG